MNPMKINFLFHVKALNHHKSDTHDTFYTKVTTTLQHPGKNPVTLSDYEINHSGGKQNKTKPSF